MVKKSDLVKIGNGFLSDGNGVVILNFLNYFFSEERYTKKNEDVEVMFPDATEEDKEEHLNNLLTCVTDVDLEQFEKLNDVKLS